MSTTQAMDREILRARARALASPADPGRANGTLLNLIEFRLANERYAVEQRYVREIHPLKTLTPLPCVSSFIRGIINIRGQIIPVIDIRRFFDLPEAGITDIHAVVHVSADDVQFGILADWIVGVREMPASELQSALPTLTGIRASYLKGIADGSLIILDTLAMLLDPRIQVNEEVRS